MFWRKGPVAQAGRLVLAHTPFEGGGGTLGIGGCLAAGRFANEELTISGNGNVTRECLATQADALASERYGELMFELRTLGCTNMALHVWDASPLVPDPVLPPGG